MNRVNPRQRIRRFRTRLLGKDRSLLFENEEHSVFLEDGSISSQQSSDTPVIQGLIPHEPEDVAGQCQTCQSFATGEMLVLCELCWEMVCRPCASERDRMVVCPACVKYLERRRWINMLRKLLIEPFVERVR